MTEHACPGDYSACRDEAEARKWAAIIGRYAFGYAFRCTEGHWHFSGAA